MQSHDSLHVFRPSPISRQSRPELSTGNPEDDELLRQIAARTSPGRPLDWRHYIYVPDEDSAQMMARPLEATGWSVEIFAPEDGDGAYCVRAGRAGVMLTPDLVRSARELFETTVSLVPGAEYDGWEAAIDVDQYGSANL
jgi:Regulator of ribonuclease activity B